MFLWNLKKINGIIIEIKIMALNYIKISNFQLKVFLREKLEKLLMILFNVKLSLYYYDIIYNIYRNHGH